MFEFLLIASTTWQNITDANFHKFRKLMVNPAPMSSRGHVVTQSQISALLGSPISCDGDTFSRFCIWQERRGDRYREIQVNWNVLHNPPTVRGWTSSGDLPY